MAIIFTIAVAVTTMVMVVVLLPATTLIMVMVLLTATMAIDRSIDESTKIDRSVGEPISEERPINRCHRNPTRQHMKKPKSRVPSGLPAGRPHG